MFVIAFTLPPEARRGPQVLVLILERENLDRMREADPLDVQLAAYPGQLDVAQPIGNLDIVIAYEEDKETLLGFARSPNVPGLLSWLERGRKHRPGDGTPPVKVTAQ